jgi:LacI family transcriptional regulator
MNSIPKVLLIIESSREYGRQFLRGIAHYSQLNGLWIFEQQIPFYLQSSRQEKLSIKSIPKVDGIIMREQPGVEDLINSGIPIVFASYLAGDSQVPIAATDDLQIGETAADHFLSRGFQHFAFVGYDSMFWSNNRRDAFAQLLENKGFTCRPFVQDRCPRRRQWDYEQITLTQWLLDLPKPAAVFCCNDDRGRQVLTAARMAGLSVPGEIAVLGVDNDEFVCSLTHPPLSSIALSVEIAGFEAAAALDAMMQKKPLPSRTIPVKVSHAVTRQSSDFSAIRDPVVAEAVQFIRQNVRKPLQIDDVLRVLAVSRRCLYDKFKKILGCSVHEFIKRRRVEQIEKMLLESDLSISEIAFRLGFTSDDHIAQYFRCETGLTPHKYRSKLKLK